MVVVVVVLQGWREMERGEDGGDWPEDEMNIVWERSTGSVSDCGLKQYMVYVWMALEERDYIGQWWDGTVRPRNSIGRNLPTFSGRFLLFLFLRFAITCLWTESI